MRLDPLNHLEPARKHRPMNLDDGLPPIGELDPVHARDACPLEQHRLNSRTELAPTEFVNKARDYRSVDGSEEREL